MTDPIESLVPSRQDAVLNVFRKSAFHALHKAGFAPPPSAKKKPPAVDDEDGSCPECGGAMADHKPPTKVPPKPVSGSEVAAAGATSIGAPQAGAEDESDAIEALAEDMGEDEEGEEDPFEEAAEGEEAEEDEDLPADDGDNHGVGDLDGDGSTESLIMEVTNLERDYYAAKGLHGDGPKAMVVLDRYHRAVRNLVRALAGASGGGAGDEATAPDEEAPDADVAKISLRERTEDRTEGRTPPVSRKNTPKPGIQAAKPKQFAAGAAKPAGKPPVVSAPAKPVAGEKQDEPDDVDPKLKKAMSDFATYHDDGPVPDAYLIDYFGAFVEEAFEHERTQIAHQYTTMTPLDWAACVLHEFVIRLPRNPNFRRIAEKYKIDAILIAKILLTLKLVKPGGDMVGLDAGNGYGNEPVDMLRSESWLGKEARGAGRDIPAREVVQLDAGQSIDPFAHLRKSSVEIASAIRPPVYEEVIVPTESTAQRLERENAIARANILVNHFLKLG